MQPIAIKIKKSAAEAPAQNIRTASQPPPAPLANKKNRPRGMSFWFLLLLVIILTVTLAALLFFKPALPYQDLIPSAAVAVSYFNHELLADSAKVLNDSHYAWPPFVWFKNAWQELLAESKVETKQVLALFDSQMALVWLPGSAGQLDWLLLSSKKVSDSAFESAFSPIEKGLKQNYNLVSETYRQVKTTELKSLGQNQPGLYYTQIRNYFLVSNNLNSLKETIDKIIGR